MLPPTLYLLALVLTAAACGRTVGGLQPVWFIGPAENTLPVPDEDDGNIDELLAACGEDCTPVQGGTDYITQTKYAGVFRRGAGRHRLWFGARLYTADTYHNDWKSGWIELHGSTGRLFPHFCDNRAGACENARFHAGSVRSPGCYSGSSQAQGVTPCPINHLFWDYIDFEVPYGDGGGCAMTSSSTATVTDSVFVENHASKGAALSATNLVSLMITNTTFETSEIAAFSQFELIGVTTESCLSQPCQAGEYCEWNEVTYARNCAVCDSHLIGDGVSCLQCPVSKQPLPDQTDCELCPDGTSSDFGIECRPCPANTAGSGGVCEECPVGSTPNEGSTMCVPCPPGSTRPQGRLECEPCAPNQWGAGGSCVECTAGTLPDVNRTGCVECEAGRAGVGGTCLACGAGKSANIDRTACIDCQPGRFSSSGVACESCYAGSAPNAIGGADACVGCGGGEISAEGDLRCTACPERQTPSLDGTECVCIGSTYNQQLYGPFTCEGFASLEIGSAVLQDTCAQCPACLECTQLGAPRLRSGWALYKAGHAYVCPVTAGCPGGQLQNLTISVAAWSLAPEETDFSAATLATLGPCSEGYSGPICGNCAEDFHHLMVGRPCQSCDEGTIDVAMVIGLIFGGGIVAGIIMSGVYKILVDHGVVTDLRLLVGFYQLLGQMDNVLSISMPYPVPLIVKAIGLLFLDVRKITNLDCWDVGGLHGKLTTNIFIVPAIFIGGCILMYLNEKRTIAAVISAGGGDHSAYKTATINLKQNLFFSIFLIYPAITATLFRVPQCRSIGDRVFHEEDFEVDCESADFYFALLLSLVMIGIIPVGVPLSFYYAMGKAKSKLPGGRVSSTLLGGAKLIAQEEDDEDDQFAFLVRDCRPEYWYYEIVTYARKLCLGGLAIVVGRGTMAQGYFVVVVEAAFLSHHMRVYPYVRMQHNHVDALGHCCLILTYAISLILRNDDSDFTKETFPREGYGWFIAFLYGVILPIPTIVHFCRGRKEDRKLPDEERGTVVNPLDVPGTDMGGTFETDETRPGEGAVATTTAVGVAAGTSLNGLARIQRDLREAKQQIKNLKSENAKLLGAQQAGGAAADGAPAAVSLPAAIADDGESAVDDAAPAPAPEAKLDAATVKMNALKALAEDESLSEEVRAGFKESIEATHALSIAKEKSTLEWQTRELALAQVSAERNFKKKEIRLDMSDFERASGLETLAGSKDLLRSWLVENRLIHHETKILEVAGRYASVEDLGLLSKEDMQTISASMMPVEATRFATAVARNE